MIFGTPSFDLEFNLEGQMPSLRSWFVYAAQGDYLSFETILVHVLTYKFRDNIRHPVFDLEFDLEGQMPSQRLWLCKLLREATYRLRPFGTCADVISGRYPVPCYLL